MFDQTLDRHCPPRVGQRLAVLQMLDDHRDPLELGRTLLLPQILPVGHLGHVDQVGFEADQAAHGDQGLDGYQVADVVHVGDLGLAV